jgi:hypothetical protein
MAMPKSEKLVQEEQQNQVAFYNRYDEVVKPAKIDPAKLAPIQCLNEFVALLPYYQTSSTIHLPGEGLKSDEGLVIGVGDQVHNVQVGDVVKYSTKHIAHTMSVENGAYKDLKIILLSVKSLYCKIEKK